MTLRDSECGVCRLEGPDRFGNYDLIDNSDCPLHGSAVGMSGSIGVLPGGFFARMLRSSKDAA